MHNSFFFNLILCSVHRQKMEAEVPATKQLDNNVVYWKMAKGKKKNPILFLGAPAEPLPSHPQLPAD